MKERTERANLLLINAKKLLESARQSNSSDEDSFTLNMTPQKKSEINCDEECILSPMTNNTSFNQSHDNITVDSRLFDTDSQAEDAQQTTSQAKAKHIITDLRSTGEFIQFMMSNANISIRPLQTEQSDEKLGCDSIHDGVCIADHVGLFQSEVQTQTVSETKSSNKSCDKDEENLIKICNLSTDDNVSKKQVNDENLSSSRDDITLKYLQVAEKIPKHIPVCYFQNRATSFEQEKSTTDKSIDSNTTETSQTNTEESYEGKTSNGTSSCHSPPSVQRQSSFILSSSESDLIKDLEFLSEVNWRLHCENVSLKEDMNDFDGILEVLEDTLGINNISEHSEIESLDAENECPKEHLRDIIGPLCDEDIDGEKKTTNFNDKNFAPTTRDQRGPNFQSFQDAIIGAHAPHFGLSSGNHNVSMPRTESLDSKISSKEVSVQTENEKLMLSAIKSLHKCTRVHVRRHYDYRRMLKTCSKKPDTVTVKYESTDGDLKEATRQFHEYRAKFFLEQDKREELSHTVSDLVKKMNNLRRIIRQSIEEKQNMSAHLDRLIDDWDFDVNEYPDHHELSQSMEIQMLKEELQKSREKNQVLEESLRIVRQYMDSSDIDEDIIFEVNRAAKTRIPS